MTSRAPSPEVHHLSAMLAACLGPAVEPPRAVAHNDELERVKSLPRRVWYEEDPAIQALTAQMSAWLRAPGSNGMLRAIQAIALSELYYTGGLFAPMRVGSGKCVAGETEVWDASTGRRRRADEIGALSVPAMGPGGKLAIANATAFASGEKECFELTLADGSRIVLSHDHPVFTARGWVHASKIQTDDLIATPRSMPALAKTLEIPHDEVAFAAYLLSDGSVSQATTGFTNGTPAVLRDFIGIAQRLADHTRNLSKSWKQNGITYASKPSAAYEMHVSGVSWFRRKWDINGLAKEKRLPAEFWGLSLDHTALFLNRFWACDGWVDNKGPAIVLASEHMIDDLRFLLLRLGVHTRKSEKPSRCQGKIFPAWRLAIPTHSIERFFETVGLVLGKEEASQACLDVLRSKKRNTNVDVVPISRPECYEMAAEIGMQGRGGDWRARARNPLRRTALTKALGATGGQHVGRDTFARVCESYRYQGRHKWLATSDLCWERVRSLQAVGIRQVYDLSVPSHGCFVGNNIVLHNTAVTFLAAVVRGAQRPVLVIPAKLRSKTEHEFQRLYTEWRGPPLPNGIRIVNYEQLSRDYGDEQLRDGRGRPMGLLELSGTDLIICDEVHRLKNEGAACTRKMRHFMNAYPDTPFVGLSGTITNKSILDYAHILVWCLKNRAPVPRSYTTLHEWANAIDVKVKDEDRLEVGALLELADTNDVATLDPLTAARRGYRRRLIETPGIVAYSKEYDGASLFVREITDGTPAAEGGAEHKVRFGYNEASEKAFADLRAWKRPDTSTIPDGMTAWRHARELALGFNYLWSPWPPLPWKNARAEWHKTVRAVLANNNRGFDSEKQVALACSGSLHPSELHDRATRERWAEHRRKYAEWQAIKPTFTPNKVPWWIDEGPLQWCAAWMRSHKGIVWVEHIDFARRLAQLTGAPYFGEGGIDVATRRTIEQARPNRDGSIIASIESNKEGRNLQEHWCENLITSAMSTADAWEQLLGRTHREGQLSDEVSCDVIVGCREQAEAWLGAKIKSQYIVDTSGLPAKILFCDQTMPTANDVVMRAATTARYWASSLKIAA